MKWKFWPLALPFHSKLGSDILVYLSSKIAELCRQQTEQIPTVSTTTSFRTLNVIMYTGLHKTSCIYITIQLLCTPLRTSRYPSNSERHKGSEVFNSQLRGNTFRKIFISHTLGASDFTPPNENTACMWAQVSGLMPVFIASLEKKTKRNLLQCHPQISFTALRKPYIGMLPIWEGGGRKNISKLQLLNKLP